MTQTQKLTPEQCALLCDVLRSLQHELEALKSKAEALDRAGLDNCLTTAEAERLRFLAAVIADLWWSNLKRHNDRLSNLKRQLT